jgi:ankyrin repeat protein
MPEAIGLGIEKMSFDEMKGSICDGIIPLIHLDQEYGYESTLNYLNRLHPQERLIEKLCNFAVGNSTPNAITTLSFLSRSNLAEGYKDLEVLKIKDTSIKLIEIASLTAEELEVLHITESNHLIRVCIAEYYSNLFELYCKKIRLSTKELTEEHGLSKCTPLHYAARYCQVDVIKEILETDGIDKQSLLEIQDKYGNTALSLAVYKGHVKALTVILETPGIDMQKLLKIQSRSGRTALQYAIEHSKVDVIKIILHLAAHKGQVEALKLILETPGIDKQALLEMQDKFGYTSLHWAAYKGHAEAVKTILETPGIDTQKLLEIQDGLGKTVLHKAAYEGHVEATKVILKIPGIDKQKLLEIKDKQGATALNWAIHKGHVKEIKELFRHQITTVGIRGNEKKAISFLKPEELQEILEIEFSDELGKANSAVRIERETLVLNAYMII